MSDDIIVNRLFSAVLTSGLSDSGVNANEIRTGIQNMKEIYKPNPSSLNADYSPKIANYNDASHRCAYLHKYAPFHTALVAEMLQRAFQGNSTLYQDMICSSGSFNLCSLGGGPGNDVLGVLSVLNSLPVPHILVSASIIDIMPEWSLTFASLIDELRYGSYGTLGESVSKRYFSWSYTGCNLLQAIPSEVRKKIRSADLLTMVKFVSAAACRDTSFMINDIFQTMKPGAMVLFIDNAGGGFHQMMCTAANESGLLTVFGPLRHEHYVNRSFNTVRFGYTPCLETKVSVHIWKKPGQKRQSHSSNSKQRILPSDYNLLEAQLLQTKLKNSKLLWGITPPGTTSTLSSNRHSQVSSPPIREVSATPSIKNINTFNTKENIVKRTPSSRNSTPKVKSEVPNPSTTPQFSSKSVRAKSFVSQSQKFGRDSTNLQKQPMRTSGVFDASRSSTSPHTVKTIPQARSAWQNQLQNERNDVGRVGYPTQRPTSPSSFKNIATQRVPNQTFPEEEENACCCCVIC